MGGGGKIVAGVLVKEWQKVKNREVKLWEFWLKYGNVLKRDHPLRAEKRYKNLPEPKLVRKWVRQYMVGKLSAKAIAERDKQDKVKVAEWIRRGLKLWYGLDVAYLKQRQKNEWIDAIRAMELDGYQMNRISKVTGIPEKQLEMIMKSVVYRERYGLMGDNW